MIKEECFENVLVKKGGFQGLLVRVYWKGAEERNRGAVILVPVAVTGGKLAIRKSGKLAPWSLMPTTCLDLEEKHVLLIRDFLRSVCHHDLEHVIVSE